MEKKIYFLVALVCLLTGVLATVFVEQPVLIEKARGQGSITTLALITNEAFSKGAIELSNTSFTNPIKTVFVAKEICLQAIAQEQAKCKEAVK